MSEFCSLFQPDLSSDDDDNDPHPYLPHSSSLTNPSLKSPLIQSEMNIDPMQNEDLLPPMIHTSKSPSTTSSKQSSRIVSPARSPSTTSSVCETNLLNPPMIQLPTYLEREILIKINFNELSK